VSFKIQKGERVSIIGDAVSRKEIILYFMQMHIFDTSHFEGQILANKDL
jgi:hypothetical protein